MKKDVENIKTELSTMNTKMEQMCKTSQSTSPSKCLKCEVDKKVQVCLRVNYASESLGAQIVHTEDKPYHKSNFVMGMLSSILPGIKRYSNGPRQLLSDSVQPGLCYAFKGSRSLVIIKLAQKIKIDSLALEHIKEQQSPSGNLTSAPKDFEIYVSILTL